MREGECYSWNNLACLALALAVIQPKRFDAWRFRVKPHADGMPGWANLIAARSPLDYPVGDEGGSLNGNEK